jgi:hypothetical protein
MPAGKILPVARWGGPPPNDCPICGEKIWSGPAKKVQDITLARVLYDGHVHEDHPDFEEWNDRVSLYYLIPMVLFFAPVPLAFFSWPFWFVLPVGLLGGLYAGGSIHSLKQRGEQRFHEQWKREYATT